MIFWLHYFFREFVINAKLNETVTLEIHIRHKRCKRIYKEPHGE